MPSGQRTVSHSFRCGTGFVDEVDGLVGQEAVVDEFGTRLYCEVHGLVVVFDMVELLVARLQLP